MMPTKVSESVRRLNPSLFDAPLIAVARTEYATERALQDKCEAWLESRGYKRLTAENALAAKGEVGWFGHLAQPKGNPFMPDLFIFDSRSCLLVELKVREDYRPGQLAMIERGQWIKATTLNEFSRIVSEWEQHNKEAHQHLLTPINRARILRPCLQTAALRHRKAQQKTN